ncbi:MAG: hypothetical protein DRJ60_07225 [Thermoprotei archaeon]|nr:MAG: hypothetical protein DRJ60_07225 [Thermoprotei archaeon]
MSIPPELRELIIGIVEERIKELRLSHKEFRELRRSISRLEEAQAKTEEKLLRLEVAQIKTEERLSRLEEAIERLIEAQTKTEEKLLRLEEAQIRTEEKLLRLGEAQAKTERAIQELARAVGRLSDVVGFGLEDIGRVVIPGWLQRHLGIQLEGELGEELKRAFIEVDGREIEVNLYGEGFMGNERIAVICEVKSRIYQDDVDKFYNNLVKPIEKSLYMKIIPVLFGYLIHPKAKARARELGVYVIASYER